MNSITRAQYDALKNDRSFTVLSFDRETGARAHTYSGLNLVTAMREVMLKQYRFDVLVIRNLKDGEFTLPNKSDYASYKHHGQHLDLPER